MSQAIPRGWITIADLAAARGVDRSAIQRRVTKLAALDLIDVRKVGRAAIINRKKFDLACAATTDAIREANGNARKRSRPKGAQTVGETLALADEQARRTRLAADLLQLRLDERRGRLLPAEEVRAAMAEAGAGMVSVLERFSGRSAEIVETALEHGNQGVRVLLKNLIYALRTQLAEAMGRLAKREECATDPTLGEAQDEPA